MTRHSSLGIAIALATIPVTAQGLSRFAYTLLLPIMQRDLSWSFALAGVMNTANGLGYLLGALVATTISRRAGTRRTLRLTVVGLTLALAASAVADSVVVLLAVRLLSGALAALAFVIGAAIVTHLEGGASGRGPSLVGVYFGGVGLGIALSGLIVTPVSLWAPSDASAWRLGWVALAVSAIVVTIPATYWVTRHLSATDQSTDAISSVDVRAILPFLISYTLFGCGYIGYVTFIVAYFESRGIPGSGLWILLGTAALLGPAVTLPIVARLPLALGVGTLVIATACGAALPLVVSDVRASILSVVIFGIAFLSVMAAFTAEARRVLPSGQWTGAVATLTAGFATGQAVGPIATGIVSDGSGRLSAGLLVSVGLLVISALAVCAQRGRSA